MTDGRYWMMSEFEIWSHEAELINGYWMMYEFERKFIDMNSAESAESVVSETWMKSILCMRLFLVLQRTYVYLRGNI